MSCEVKPNPNLNILNYKMMMEESSSAEADVGRIDDSVG
jgi:hypothetical protein